MKSTYLDLQSDHSKKPTDEGVFFLMFWMSFMWTRIFWALSTLVYFPRNVSFFLKKTMGSLDSVDSKINIFHFFISPDTLRSDFFPPTLDGWFFLCFFSGLEVCFQQSWRGFIHHLGISRPQPIQKEVLFSWVSRTQKTKEKKQPPPNKKTQRRVKGRGSDPESCLGFTSWHFFLGDVLLNFQGCRCWFSNEKVVRNTPIHLLVPSQPGSPAVSFREGSI